MVAFCCPVNWPTRQDAHVTVLYLGPSADNNPDAWIPIFNNALEEVYHQIPDQFWVKRPWSITWFNTNTPVLELEHPYLQGINEILKEEIKPVTDGPFHFPQDEWSEVEYQWVDRYKFNPHLTLKAESEELDLTKMPLKIQLQRPKLWWKGWQ